MYAKMTLEGSCLRTIGGISSRPYDVLLGRCLNILPTSRYEQKKFEGSVSTYGLVALLESDKTVRVSPLSRLVENSVLKEVAMVSTNIWCLMSELRYLGELMDS